MVGHESVAVRKYKVVGTNRATMRPQDDPDVDTSEFLASFITKKQALIVIDSANRWSVFFASILAFEPSCNRVLQCLLRELLSDNKEFHCSSSLEEIPSCSARYSSSECKSVSGFEQ